MGVDQSEKNFAQLNQITHVSRETFHDLERYVDLLMQWNRKVNLISAQESDIWERHIIDAAQLIKNIPEEAKIITDLGCGAGLPGVVIGLIKKCTIHLVESDKKKCAFLFEATRISNKPEWFIHNDRIEKLDAWESDVVTARALAPLEKLLPLTHDFIKKAKITLFFKGQNVVEEIVEISKAWEIEYELIPSITSADSAILQIISLKEEYNNANGNRK